MKKSKRKVALIFSFLLMTSITLQYQPVMGESLERKLFNRANSGLMYAVSMEEDTVACLGFEGNGPYGIGSWVAAFSADGTMLWDLQAEKNESFNNLQYFNGSILFVSSDTSDKDDYLCVADRSGRVHKEPIEKYAFIDIVHSSVWLINRRNETTKISQLDEAFQPLWTVELEIADTNLSSWKETDYGAAALITERENGYLDKVIEIDHEKGTFIETKAQLDMMIVDFMIQENECLILSYDLNDVKEHGYNDWVHLDIKTGAIKQSKITSRMSEELHHFYRIEDKEFLLLGSEFMNDGVNQAATLYFIDEKGNIDQVLNDPFYNVGDNALLLKEDSICLVGTHRNTDNRELQIYSEKIAERK